MENRDECLCHADENHQEIGCFFKYVIFLLKRFVSSLDLLGMDPKDAHKEFLKNDIWIQIATQYDGYYTGKINAGAQMIRFYRIRRNNKFLFCQQIVIRTARVWMAVC